MRTPTIAPAATIASAFAFAAAPVAAQDTAAPTPAAARATMVVEWTRLKALPGERANLTSFVFLNWFAMDAKAVEQGLFTSYRLIANPSEDGEWDLLVEVGYPTPLGYDDPATQAAFESIRAAHTTIPVAGKSLQELGTILGTERLPVLTGTR
ncbi:MAG: hypothetical protein ACKO01_11005 [Erythrobacter sp.]